MTLSSKRRVKVFSAIFLVVYMAALAYVCFFSEKYGRTNVYAEYHYNLIPFNEIKRFFTYRDEIGLDAFIINMLGNVLVFSPFGFFVPVIAPRFRRALRMILLTLLLSLVIEIIQLLCRVGSFDVDDLILNTFGGWLGYIVFRIFNYLRIRKIIRAGHTASVADAQSAGEGHR